MRGSCGTGLASSSAFRPTRRATMRHVIATLLIVTEFTLVELAIAILVILTHLAFHELTALTSELIVLAKLAFHVISILTIHFIAISIIACLLQEALETGAAQDFLMRQCSVLICICFSKHGGNISL